MKKAIMWALTIFVIMLITGCQVTAPQTSVETYSNTRFGFSINYPDGWKVSEDDELYGTTINFFKEGAAGVSILAWEPSGNPLFDFYSLEDFYERGVIGNWRDHEGFELLEEHDTVIDKLPAKEFTFTYKTTDFVFKESILALLDTRHNKAISDSNAIKIIYDMPIDMYDDYHQDFRLIVDTFKFTE